MNADWRELLDRVLDGDELSEAEALVLADALDEETNRRAAAERLHFEAELRDRLAPQPAEELALARERLLAKAFLREKRRSLRLDLPTRRLVGRRVVTATLAATVLLALLAGWLLWKGSHHQPQARGDFRIVRAGNTTHPALPLQEGDHLIAGRGGAQLTLGGYCRLALEPDTEIVLQSEPRKEVVELTHGKVVSRIQPERGAFTVLTPLGSIEVVGTEFVTTVEYPELPEGGNAMSKLNRSVVVSILVVSGAVMYNLADTTGVLHEGMSRAFAGEKSATRGTVVSITDFTVTLKTKGKTEVTFHAWKENKLAVHEIGQLRPGDRVTVTWAEEEGRKWVKDIDGKGTVTGTVTAKGEVWIEVAPEEGKPQKLIPPWRGGNPSDGGGLDKKILKQIAAVKVGDKVVLSWAMPEGKRVVGIKPAE